MIKPSETVYMPCHDQNQLENWPDNLPHDVGTWDASSPDPLWEIAAKLTIAVAIQMPHSSPKNLRACGRRWCKNSYLGHEIPSIISVEFFEFVVIYLNTVSIYDLQKIKTNLPRQTLTQNTYATTTWRKNTKALEPSSVLSVCEQIAHFPELVLIMAGCKGGVDSALARE